MEYITFSTENIEKIEFLLNRIDGKYNSNIVKELYEILDSGERSKEFEDGIISFRKGANPSEQSAQFKEKKELKTSLSKVVGAYYILDKLNNDPTLSFKIHYWCMRNNQVFNDSVSFFQKERNKLYKEYAKSDEDIFVKSKDNPDIVIFNIKDEFFQRTLDTAEKIRKSCPECTVNVYDIADQQKMKAEIKSSEIFANATIVGMKPMENESVIKDLSAFRKGLVVCDAVYNPKETKLLKEAKEAGCICINGEGMLVWQGAAAFKLYTGKQRPVEGVKKLLFG